MVNVKSLTHRYTVSLSDRQQVVGFEFFHDIEKATAFAQRDMGLDSTVYDNYAEKQPCVVFRAVRQ